MGFAGFKKMSTHQEIIYKPEDKLTQIWKDIPTLDMLIGDGPDSPAPQVIVESMKGLNDVIDGLKTVEMVGLPDKWEVVTKFTNVHVTPLLVEILKLKPKRSIFEEYDDERAPKVMSSDKRAIVLFSPALC